MKIKIPEKKIGGEARKHFLMQLIRDMTLIEVPVDRLLQRLDNNAQSTIYTAPCFGS